MEINSTVLCILRLDEGEPWNVKERFESYFFFCLTPKRVSQTSCKIAIKKHDKIYYFIILNLKERTKMTKNDITKQLDILFQQYNLIFKHRATIKNWCITVWVALLAAITTGKINLTPLSTLLLMISQVFFFWFLEAIYGGIYKLHNSQIIELEYRLSNKNYESNDPLEIYFLSRYRRFTNWQKVKSILYAFFRMETVMLIYLVLIFASVVFVVSISKIEYISIVE
ncbi:hypothetical protein ES703_08948 [subsurface metagenome]